uniref:Uncharacterized protein n=1 Tax=Neovison vison TaxID=452646 RepID=A0A8C7BS77_NEOVI
TLPAELCPRSLSSESTFSLRPPQQGAHKPGLLESQNFRRPENAKSKEIPNSLKHILLRGWRKPSAALLFFLREALPVRRKDCTVPRTDPKFITWSLVGCNDVAWNCETFLVGPDGVPVCTYSFCFPAMYMEPGIEALGSQGPSCA